MYEQCLSLRFAGWAFCGHKAIELPSDSDSLCLDDAPLMGRHGVDDRASVLSRSDKVEAGLLSKVLLDYGRLAWIRAQNCSLHTSEMLSYVENSTSGENRLLVVSLNDATAGQH